MHKTIRILRNFRMAYIALIESQARTIMPALTAAANFSCLSPSSALKRLSCGSPLIVDVQKQPRRYLPHDSNENKNDCWFCEAKTTKWKHMICDDCGHLRDVDKDINYFDLLNCPRKFGLELKQLTKHFRDMQYIVHPDRFSAKSLREQINSLDWSSLINTAYKTLFAPIERGQYLLQLEGLEMPQDNSALEKVFLMEMMERNEEVEAATTKIALQKIDQRLSIELGEKVAKLTELFEARDFKMATSILVEMKYLSSIKNSIKEKQQKKMGG